MILSISNQLINMPEQLDKLEKKMPYGGPAVPRMVYLCRSMEKAQQLAQEYWINKWWKGDHYRLERDELNLGTLLYAYSSNELDRNFLMEELLKSRTGKPFLKKLQQVNLELRRKAKKERLISQIEASFVRLSQTMLHIYEDEHPELHHVDELNIMKMGRKPKPKKAISYYQRTLKTIQSFDLFKDDLEMSMEVFQEPSTFYCTFVSLSFDLDYAMKEEILLHNDRLVQNPRLRARNRKNDQMLYEEAQKALMELTGLLQHLEEKIQKMQKNWESEEKGAEAESEERSAEIMNVFGPLYYAELFAHAVGLFCIFLKYIAEGLDIRVAIKESPYLKALINGTFKLKTDGNV